MKPAGTITNTMPERIYAKTHGASTDVISGQRGLIGGWNEHRRDGQTEFIRSDLALLHLPQGEQSAARELVLEEAARWHDGEAERKRSTAVKSRRLDAQIATHEVSAAHFRSSACISSPDHADAGKVEGDVEKWSIREIVAKAIAYHSVGDPHAKTIRGDQRWEWFVEEADKFISVFGYYLPAIPPAPASEDA